MIERTIGMLSAPLGIAVICLLVMTVCVLLYAMRKAVDWYHIRQVVRGNRSSSFTCSCGHTLRVADVLDTARGVYTCVCGKRYVYIGGKLAIFDPVSEGSVQPEDD